MHANKSSITKTKKNFEKKERKKSVKISSISRGKPGKVCYMPEVSRQILGQSIVHVDIYN